MGNKAMDTEFLDRAMEFAIRAHKNTERRGKGFPYVIHPFEAVEIVASITPDQELLAAAALHDTIEDTGVTVQDLRREFGDRVADLVQAESDQFTEGVSEEDSWHDRKRAAIERLAAAPFDAKIVAMGDKLSNMRAIYRDYINKGDELWKIFHAKERADHEWHYHGLADSLRELADTDAYREFVALFLRVFESQEKLSPEMRNRRISELGIDFTSGSDAITLRDAILQNPQQMEQLARAFAGELKKLHSTPCDTVYFPNVKRVSYKRIENDRQMTATEKATAKSFVNSVPAAQTCLAGNLSLNSMVLDENGLHWTGLKNLCYGDPMFDLAHLFIRCRAYRRGALCGFWDAFAKEYFKGQNVQASCGHIADFANSL